MNRAHLTTGSIRLIIVCLAALLLTACGNPKKPAPISQDIVTTMIGQLAQGDIIKIATHYRNKQAVNTFMQENTDLYSLNDTFNEDTEVIEDYMPTSTVYLAGFSIGYAATTAGELKDIGVGLQQKLFPLAESLVAKAIHTSYQKKKDSPTLASKQSYYLGYMQLDDQRRLDITLEQTTTKDMRNLYSFLYEIVAQSATPKK